MELFVCTPEGKQKLPVRRSIPFDPLKWDAELEQRRFFGHRRQRSENQEAQSILSGTPAKIPITMRFWGFVVLKFMLGFGGIYR